jgi:cytosine/creatinine deaminase
VKAEVRGKEQKLDVTSLILEENARQAANVKRDTHQEGRDLMQEYARMLEVAIQQARLGLAEGGIPIGAALFDGDGMLLGAGHNRRVQENDPSVHGETDAFRKAGRQRSYRDKIMVTSLAPCWYCSGLVRQFQIGTLVVGESVNFRGGIDWLSEHGTRVVDLHSAECVQLLAKYIAENPAVWHEDIGEE